MNFTVEETNLMCIYGVNSRTSLIAELEEMQSHLQADETELNELTKSVLHKLNAISDEEFEEIKVDIVGDFDIIIERKLF